MASNFPGGYDSFSPKTDGVDDVLAAHVNALQDAISAVEHNLGLAAQGSLTDLVTRLAVSLNNDGTLKSGAFTPGAGSITHAMLAANSVDTGNIIDGTITGTDIAAATVTGSNLVNGTVTAAQVASGTLTGTQLTTNQAVRRANSALGTVPTTGSVECGIIIPATGQLTAVRFVSKDSLVGSDTNYFTVVVTDRGTDGSGSTVQTSGAASDTTKVTGGTNGVAAYGSTPISMLGLTVNAGEVLQVVLTVTGTLPNTLTNCFVSATVLTTT